MGESLFNAGTLKRKGTAISDGRGGQYHGTATETSIRVLIEEYKEFIRAQLGIPADQRKAIILANNVARPNPEDLIVIDGRDWIIVEVETDPALATYTCRVK